MEECVYFVYKFITSDDYLIAESQKHSKRPCKLQPIAMSAKTNGISKYTTEQHTAKVSQLSMACLISPFICMISRRKINLQKTMKQYQLKMALTEKKREKHIYLS